MTVQTATGAIIRADSLQFVPAHGARVATAVGPHLGARRIRLDVVHVPAGATWADDRTAAEENVVVTVEGAGDAASGAVHGHVTRGDAMFTPTGDHLRLTADRGGPLTAYVWRTTLQPGRRPGTDPRRFSHLMNDETQLRGFYGTVPGAETGRAAPMNFIFWPGTGTPQLCLHCGVMQPGEYFNIHTHPESEEAFFAFEGTGQLHLDGRWYDARPGDVLFAPPGVPHGTRHPYDDPSLPRFVTCGGPTPFDAVLYQRAGVPTEVR